MEMVRRPGRPLRRSAIASRSAIRSLAALSLLAALAACTPGRDAGPGPSGSAPPGRAATPVAPARASEAQILALAKQLSGCLRANGLPDFPDPVMVDGRPEWPGEDKLGAPAAEAKRACAAIQERLETAVAGVPSSAGPRGPLSAGDLAKARGFAGCMRQHGLAGFPDPDSDGVFHVGGTPVDSLFQQKNPPSKVVEDAFKACREFSDYPGWGIRA